jgi:hypothetical protein
LLLAFSIASRNVQLPSTALLSANELTVRVAACAIVEKVNELNISVIANKKRIFGVFILLSSGLLLCEFYHAASRCSIKSGLRGMI